VKTLAIVKYVFLLAGIAMLAGAVFVYQSTSTFLATAITTKGTVVDLERSRSNNSTTYRPVVQFKDRAGREHEFTSSTGSNPPSYSTGESVEVYYLSEQPEMAKMSGFFALWGGATILGGIGGTFLLVSAGMILVPMLKARRDDYLKHQGTPIETEFQSVEINGSLSVNGRHPFRVVTHWQNPSTSEIHVFRSNNLWYDPSDYIKRDRITVFIEKGNPGKYFVDLSFLPRMAE